MATCPNCKKKLSCGCQKRQASNGQMVCVNCLGAYEKKLSPNNGTITELTSEEIESATTQWSEFINKFKS